MFAKLLGSPCFADAIADVVAEIPGNLFTPKQSRGYERKNKKKKIKKLQKKILKRQNQ